MQGKNDKREIGRVWKIGISGLSRGVVKVRL